MPLAHALPARARHWAGVLASAGLMQALVQGLAFATGLLVVWSLEPTEYALYTIAYSALGAMAVVSDSGISSGLLAAGGRVWTDRAALGGVLAAGLALRRRLAAIVAALAIPGSALLLAHQGVEPWVAIGVALALVPLFLATLTTNLLEVVARLHQELVPLQATHAVAHTSRFALLAAGLAFLPLAAVALLLAAAPQWWANRRIRARASRFATPGVAADPVVGGELLGYVRRSLPLTLYYALSSQLTVLLVSLFGTVEDVASVGALGRLAMVLAVVGGVFSLVAVPRFARLAADTRLVHVRYWQAQAALAAACALPALLVWLAPGPVLAVLGPHYRALEGEALLIAASTAVAAVGGAALSLGAARGVIAPPRIVVPACIVVQALLVLLLPVDTVAGVLWVALFSAAAQWAIHAGYFAWHLRRTVAGGDA